ncbi:hypothetical protein TGPRC2_256010 [Toxoplasma gondii TgCatPRC2]|uniref:Uncharacterized protein n=1 Tax=Toxoplasma gondii TgCatPRC2 TaxID=1130821 RepID=A0A151H272_TOXGO|nr:hypothetical protein TGPRC2_256010 [Toxoplasma gondii TgCatPRC2]
MHRGSCLHVLSGVPFVEEDIPQISRVSQIIFVHETVPLLNGCTLLISQANDATRSAERFFDPVTLVEHGLPRHRRSHGLRHRRERNSNCSPFDHRMMRCRYLSPAYIPAIASLILAHVLNGSQVVCFLQPRGDRLGHWFQETTSFAYTYRSPQIPSASHLLQSTGSSLGGTGPDSKSTVQVQRLLALDSVFAGKYAVWWTIRDFRRKWAWRQRRDRAPPLRTSRFPFAGINSVQMQFWPSGNQSAKPGFVSLAISIPECWKDFHYPINMYVGGYKRGPLCLHTSEYFKVANSFCRLQDLQLDNDQVTVGFEIDTSQAADRGRS